MGMEKRLRVGLIGYGRAGQAVARILGGAEDIDLKWIARRSMQGTSVDEVVHAPFHSHDLLASGELFELDPVDALVDFSVANTIQSYGRHAADRGICIISAISHYPEEMQGLFNALSQQTALMLSPNITLGINFLLVASKLLQAIAPFTDIEIIEEHFRDKPERSGTAVRIAETLGLDESKINSIRVGGIVGHHEVVFGFPYQTLRFVHDSISREAFGNGALFALRKLHGRPPGLYNYENLIRELILEALVDQK